MQTAIASFIQGSLFPLLPPKNPLVRDDWAALAFDRNRYEDLAPAEVWTALIRVHSARPRDGSTLGVISYNELDSGGPATYLPSSMASLQKFWLEESRFLTNHYVFSPSFDWLVRLDQDVTLIAGEAVFIDSIVAESGGMNRVFAKMMEDFDPGAEDNEGLRGYLESITRRNQ